MTSEEISGLGILITVLAGLLWWSIRQMVASTGKKIDHLTSEVDGIPPLKEQIGFINGRIEEMHKRQDQIGDRYHALSNVVMHRVEIEGKITEVEKRANQATSATEERLNNRFDRLEDKLDAIMDKVK